MDKTIRDYVRRRLQDGTASSLESIWRDARNAFPYRAPGWNYIQKLKRDFDAEVALTKETE